MFHVIFFYIPIDDTVYVGINKSNKDHHYSNVTIIICSSAFGYVPHYNPEAGHFGCQTNSQYITPLYTIMVCKIEHSYVMEHVCYHNL